MESIINNKVWYVTGTSTGVGLSLVEILLNNGEKVTAVTRYPNQTIDELKKKNTRHLENLLAIETDITNDSSVKESVEKTIQIHGRIDVVVNNSGFGLVGAVEELSQADIEKIYGVNVFGVYNVLRHTTPLLRKQRSGLILNVSSSLGMATLGGSYSAYESTKHALNGLTVTLQKELEKFNVSVVLVCPGGIVTSFLTGQNFSKASNPVEEYKTNELIEMFNKLHPLSKGVPNKVANVLYGLSTTPKEKLPKTLLLGSDSYEVVKSTYQNSLKQIEENKELTLTTDA